MGSTVMEESRACADPEEKAAPPGYLRPACRGNPRRDPVRVEHANGGLKGGELGYRASGELVDRRRLGPDRFIEATVEAKPSGKLAMRRGRTRRYPQARPAQGQTK